jgi:ribonuclease D
MGDLREEIRKIRLSLARSEGISTFRIFPNTVLDDIVAALPRTTEQLLAIKGIGPQKAYSYGPFVLQAIRSHLKESHRPDYARSSWNAAISEARLSNGTNPELRERIRAVRLALSQQDGLPAFCIFDDAVLVDLVRVIPRSPAELVTVRGIKAVKAARYGAALLHTINSCFGDRHGVDHYEKEIHRFLSMSPPLLASPSLARGHSPHTIVKPEPDSCPRPALQPEHKHHLTAAQQPTQRARRVCPVCLERRPRDAALVPCGHRLCRACAPRLRRCCICRASITSLLRLFD